MENKFRKEAEILNSIESKEINCIVWVNKKPVYGKLVSTQGSIPYGYLNKVIGEKSIK